MARRESAAAGPGSRALVVDLIRSAGPISRVELVEATGLTQPTISNIVRRLLDDGVVRETGDTVATGGKPRTMLVINSRSAYGVGIRVGTDAFGVRGHRHPGRDHRPRTGRGRRRPDRPARVPLHACDRRPRPGPAERGRSGRRRRRSPVDVARGTVPLRFPGLAQSSTCGASLSARLGVPVLLDGDAAPPAVGEFWGAAGLAASANPSDAST